MEGELNGSTASILIQLGALIEQGRHNSIRLDRVEAKLDHSAKLVAAKLVALEHRTAAIPRLEKVLKSSLAFASPLAILYMTNSHQLIPTAFRALFGLGH
jgi:hypothetical protein